MTELFRDIQYVVWYAFEDGNNVLKNRLLVVWIHYTELCVTLQSIWKWFHQSSFFFFFFFFYNSWICNHAALSMIQLVSDNLSFIAGPPPSNKLLFYMQVVLYQANNWVSRRPLYGWFVPQSGPMLILNWIGEKSVCQLNERKEEVCSSKESEKVIKESTLPCQGIITWVFKWLLLSRKWKFSHYGLHFAQLSVSY